MANSKAGTALTYSCYTHEMRQRLLSSPSSVRLSHHDSIIAEDGGDDGDATSCASSCATFSLALPMISPLTRCAIRSCCWLTCTLNGMLRRRTEAIDSLVA
jgi:hypothetical protein